GGRGLAPLGATGRYAARAVAAVGPHRQALPRLTPTSRVTVKNSAAGMTDRYPALDGFRALAMLSVFSFHALLSSSEFALDKWQLLPGVVWRGNAVVANLNVGVAMFFALSGFLIYRPFAAAHLNVRGTPNVRRYARRRALRIYPAYWLAFLVLLLAGDFVHITAAQVVVNLCLVQSWFHFSATS